MRLPMPPTACLLVPCLFLQPALAQGSGRVATVMGLGPDDLPATAAPIAPTDLEFDGAGNVYVLTFNGSVLRISPTGRVRRWAGIPSGGSTADGVPAREATVLAEGLDVDAGDNVWIAERSAHRVRRVDAATGVIVTIVGTGVPGTSGDGGPATAARVGSPWDVAVDGSGNVLISTENRIRRVDAVTGVITTVAGTGAAGYGGDGGPASAATFNIARRLDFDGAGNLFVEDVGNRVVRRIESATQRITTWAGNGTQGSGGDGQPATSVGLFNTSAIEVDAVGNLWIADGTHRIRKVDAATHLLSTVAGTLLTRGFAGDGGPAILALLDLPMGIAVTDSGDLLISDSLNSRLRLVDASTGIIDSIAGSGSRTYTADGFPAIRHSIGNGCILDAGGNCYFLELGPDGYVLRRIDAVTSIVTTIAGGGTDGSAAVADALDARLELPLGIVVTASGDILFSESGYFEEAGPAHPYDQYLGRNRIRRVDMSTGSLSTVAGTGSSSSGTTSFSGRWVKAASSTSRPSRTPAPTSASAAPRPRAPP